MLFIKPMIYVMERETGIETDRQTEMEKHQL